MVRGLGTAHLPLAGWGLESGSYCRRLIEQDLDCLGSRELLVSFGQDEKTQLTVLYCTVLYALYSTRGKEDASIKSAIGMRTGVLALCFVRLREIRWFEEHTAYPRVITVPWKQRDCSSCLIWPNRLCP